MPGSIQYSIALCKYGGNTDKKCSYTSKTHEYRMKELK